MSKWHMKNHENLNFHAKKPSTDTNDEMTQMLELSDKNFKVAIRQMLEWVITNTLETRVKTESISQEIEDTEKSQTETSELKNVITGIKTPNGMTQYQKGDDKGKIQWTLR